MEFQWSNVLVRKKTKLSNYLIDHKYLKDNFEYSKLGHFNISQGVILEGKNDNFKNSLSRLHLDTAYWTSTWSVSVNDFYNHQSNDHILILSGEKKLSRLSLLAQYNYNSYSNSNLKTLKTGFQFRPIDIFGVSFLKEQDMEADKNISSIYQIDFMPHNNCWILNLNYQDNFDNKRFSFNFQFNFGDDSLQIYRDQFFNYGRLR